MADIAKITLPDNNTYNIKDAIARSELDGKVSKLGDTVNGTLNVENDLNANSINAGNLIVTGDAIFSNDLRGNLVGTIGGFTVGKSVPSDAVFTDTKVTSSANHYSPSTVSGQDKTASASGATAAWSIDVVKGVTLNTDGKGHVTGLSVTSGKIPANPNTNTTYSLTQDLTDGHKITLTPSSGTAQTVTIPDNNTTYTFANGTNGFTVTPSGGTAQTVTVTPSITNNVTGSGTSGYLAKFNGANTITNGPQLGSGTTTYLRNDGSWQTPIDTKNTAGSTDTSSKIFLIGATSQAANPQTYSQDTAYVGTDGCLYSGGNKVLTSHQDISGKVSKTGDTMTGGLVIKAASSEGLVLKQNGNNQYGCSIGFNLDDIPNVPNTWYLYHDITNNKFIISHKNRISNSYFYVDSNDQITPNLRIGADLMVGHSTIDSQGCKMRYNTTTQSLDFVFV